MAIIYTSRNLPGSFGGDYTNGAWSSFMNTYAVRFTAGRGGQGGGAFEGITFTFSVDVSFPYSGNYTIRASADNAGSLNIGGVEFFVSGFQSTASANRYYDQGTYRVSGSVRNAFDSPSYAINPYGIAFTIDAPSAPSPQPPPPPPPEPPPPPPPPPPPIRPYVKISGVWTNSKNVYIKDAGSWKLCKSAYIKDGGVWKQFLKD